MEVGNVGAGFDRGEGAAVIVIPGVQGRWEWMRPALDALARRCHAISYSLARVSRDPREAFEQLSAQVDRVLDHAGVESAAVLGTSFGGLIAAHYAATRPHRTNRLILASSPSPRWTPSEVQARQIRRPWLSAPVFMALASLHTLSEMAAAIPARAAQVQFCAVQAVRIVAAPAMPPAMAARARLLGGIDISMECRHIAAPTLVITGTPALDRVVPVSSTREYLTLIPGAQYAMMEDTGHLGLVTKPEQFAQLVGDFVIPNSDHPTQPHASHP